LKIRLGEILVGVLVLLLLIGTTALWNQDRRLKQEEHTDSIRRSAAAMRAKVERWPDIESRFFEDLEPMLVDVSAEVEKSHSTEPANRILYKGLADARGKASQRWLDEQLELSYVELSVNIPAARSVFLRTIEALKYAENQMYGELSISLQAALRDDLVLRLKESPDIGNILRAKAGEKRSAFLPQVREISKPLRDEMTSIVEMSESGLLERMRTRTLQTRSGTQLAPSNGW
jgi:hypothetical protein